MFFKSMVFLLVLVPSWTQASTALFKIELALGETAFPTTMGWFDPPTTRFLSITNQSGVSMPISYQIPQPYSVDQTRSTCGSTLSIGQSCQLAVVFNPKQKGTFSAKLQVCGHQGLWCSFDPIGFNISVSNTDIISTQCADIQSRPFAQLDCESSSSYAQNFNELISRALNGATSQPHFSYFQHTPSTNETTVPCLQARQTNAHLDPLIEGGGVPLCTLMGYATSNSSSNDITSKQFPPYLTFLLGTSYPILSNTTVLDRQQELLATFGHTDMDASVQALGYTGYVNFLNDYYLQQNSTPYADCGSSAVCPSLYYLPYATTEHALETWPPSNINYWGMSGGGGSGAGYQIEAFKPGSSTHYTLFTGGGGGGGGNTTPENINTPPIALLNTGSGGGGGSQFANCFITEEGSFNGLGLGAGTGSGLSALEGHPVIYEAPPATDYSYYPPLSHPAWSHDEILTQYVSDLDYLFVTLIPQLYEEGYTITITGGGGGGSGLEFLNATGSEDQPQALSIGYGFNFCYVFNKAHQYTATDCISSPNVFNKLTFCV